METPNTPYLQLITPRNQWIAVHEVIEPWLREHDLHQIRVTFVEPQHPPQSDTPRITAGGITSEHVTLLQQWLAKHFPFDQTSTD